MNQGPGKCSRCLLRCWCVHSIPFLQVTELLIDLGQATNMNWYTRNHVGWHAVTNCIWSYDRHHDIMRTLSYNHTSIIHIQSYRYKHTHTTMQWCRTQVRDAFPWEVVQTHKVQAFTLHTFVFTIRSCCWQNCLWICGKQPTWTHTHAIIVDYTFLLIVFGLVIVMKASYTHCHTILHIQPYSHTHTTMQWCCTQVNESGPWKVLTVST